MPEIKPYMKNLRALSNSLLVLVTSSLFIISCKDDAGDKAAATDTTATVVNTEIQQLKEENAAKDSAINSFMDAFNTIQDNLNTIKEKEKMISNETKGGDVKNKQEQIVSDIQEIYDLMNQNKQKLTNLSSKFKKANLKIAELEKAIENLNMQIAQKDAEIAELKDKLEKMNLELADLNTQYEVAMEESDQKTAKLNTAYYAFGTRKELTKQGVLTKEGGFIGLGKTAQLGKDFNKNYFTKVDIRETSSIPLAAKRAKVVTNHPSSSYRIDGTKDKVEKLTILNAEEFWASSKYLVIVVE